MGPEDKEIIARWQRGDAAAFEALVRRWQQPIASVIYRLVRRSELVHDLTQEVFLRVLRARTRYCDNGSFPTWIYRIALNVARDALRRQRGRATPLNQFEPIDRVPSAESACQQKELAQIVGMAIAELPERLREVLLLRHYQGMSFEDIASVMSTPASTIKSRFSVALVRLRVRLEHLGWGPEEKEP